MATAGSNPEMHDLPANTLKEQVQDRLLPFMKGSTDNIDSYTRGIELSNACRRYYVSRVQVTEGIKSKLDAQLKSSGNRKLDKSMGTLRHEVVSLIDQDLSLMKQLLTLNERIEDLKWQRKLAGYSPVSMTTCASSNNMLDSDGCLHSDWDGDSVSLTNDKLTVPMEYGSDLCTKYPSPSNLSVFRDCTYDSIPESLHHESSFSPTQNAAIATTRGRSSQQRSTSDLGSSDELVNSVPDVTKPIPNFRLSKADSCFSMDCPSNNSSLQRSEYNGSSTTTHEHITYSKGLENYQKNSAVGIRVQVEDDDDSESQYLHKRYMQVKAGDHTDDYPSKKYSHDSGIQVIDSNMEMII